MDTIRSLGIQRLYKFKTFDIKNYYQDLLSNILYFPSRSQLNDPFDSHIPIRYDLCTKKELVKISEKLNLRFNKNASRSERRSKVFQQVKSLKKEIKHSPEIIESRMNEFIEERLGIFSLTEERDNLLLWAHYADAHKGFCIEFAAPLLSNILINGFVVLKKKAFLHKTNYQKEYPIIHPIRHSYEDRIKLQLCTKSMDWSYEREWRIILMEHSKQKEEIHPEIITNIYFGLCASNENIEKSLSILRKSNPKIGLYKAVKKMDAFGLDFEKLTS